MEVLDRVWHDRLPVLKYLGVIALDLENIDD